MKFAKQTLEKMAQYEALGFEIIVGNNPYLNKAKKYASRKVVRIAQTNSRFHAHCVRTVWAVK